MSERLTSRELREIGIGAIAVLVLALVLGTSYLEEPRALERQTGAYRLIASFPKADGLALDDPVYLYGVKVGSVVELALNDAFQAVVTFRIDGGTELPVDTSASIHTDGLFGSKFVRLVMGGSEEVLADGDHLRYTQGALLLSRLMELMVANARQKNLQCAEALETARMCIGSPE